MLNLILIEVNKFFRRKKNLLTLCVFIIFMGIYVFANMLLNDQINRSKINSYSEEISSTKKSLDDLKLQNDKNGGEINKLKTLISDTENKLNLLQQREVARYNNNWKEELSIQLKLDKKLLKDIQSGDVISGTNIDDLKNRIGTNQLLYDKGIRPIDEQCEMNAYNFVRLACRDILPLLIIIIVLLLSSDIISSENDEGTFKFLLVQPISRGKVVLSKILAISIVCLLSIFIIIFCFVILLGFINGFGNPEYPINYYNGSFTSFILNLNGKYNMQFIGMKKFIILSMPVIFMVIIFTASLGVLISTIIENSTSAICIAIVVAIALNIVNSQLKFFKKISHFIPFTYNNVVKLLDGSLIFEFNNKNLTCLTGLAILTAFTVVFYITSIVIFRRKDIVC